MTTTLVISADSRSRIEAARAWLEACGSAAEAVILGGSLAAANDLARASSKATGATCGWHRLTLLQLAANVALPTLAERGLASISQIGTAATVASIVHRMRTDGRIGAFASVAHMPGLPRAIAAVIAELRLARLSPEVVSPVAPDLAALLVAYEAELAELALTDWSGILAAGAESAAAHRLAGLPLLMLDVPVTSEAELAFLRNFTAGAPKSSQRCRLPTARPA
jgi:hypothetical protein